MATLAVAAFAVPGLHAWGRTLIDQLGNAWKYRRETYRESRMRMLGAYAGGIERIRAEIPADSEYLVVEGKPGDGAHNFVVYDLSPRRALYLGAETGSIGALRRAGRPERCPAWVVISYGSNDSPALVSADDFFAGRP